MKKSTARKCETCPFKDSCLWVSAPKAVREEYCDLSYMINTHIAEKKRKEQKKNYYDGASDVVKEFCAKSAREILEIFNTPLPSEAPQMNIQYKGVEYIPLEYSELCKLSKVCPN